MRPRQSLPRLWLMTDERMGDALWDALARLPNGAGVIFRHYLTAPAERRALFERVRAVARRRRLVLVLAGTARHATAWQADGVHGRARQAGGVRRLLRTMPVHDAQEMVGARRVGADLALISPVFATRSHARARTLGTIGFGGIARGAGRATRWIPARAGMTKGKKRPLLIALGGMSARRFRSLACLGAYGWAAIDAWALPQPSPD